MARRALPHRVPRRGRAPGGFTLVELLVALAAMALLALMSWRGLEGMASVQSSHRARADAVLVLQTALSQWQADLDASGAFGSGVPAIDWDGRALRLTRRGPVSDAAPGVHVVAWAQRMGAGGPRWWRWQSPPVATRAEWQQAWAQAAAWAQNAATLDDGATPLLPLAGWSIAYFRDGVWGPAVAAEALGAQQPLQPLPDGLRLVLQLAPGEGLSGTVTRDWVRPTYGAARGG